MGSRGLTAPDLRRRRSAVKDKLLHFWLLAGVLGCSTASETLPQDLTPNPTTPETGVCASEENAFELQGQWAVRLELEVQGSERPDAWVTLCPENPQVGIAIAWMKLDYAANATDGSAPHTATVCALELPIVTAAIDNCPSDPTKYLEVRMSLGEAFRQYLPSVALTGTTYAGTETPQSAYRTEAIQFLGGQAGADDDGDGQEGVTLDFTMGGQDSGIAGSVFASFELSTLLRGQARNPRCIEGAAEVTLDYQVTDSDIYVIGNTEEMKTEEAVKNIPGLQVLSTSTFRSLRADGEELHDFDDDDNGDISCTEIIAHASLFQR
jgi:hypothetical protein